MSLIEYSFKNSKSPSVKLSTHRKSINKKERAFLLNGPILKESCSTLLLKDDVFCVDEMNHVKSKDQQLLEPLHLLEKETYSYEELQQHAKQYLTKEVFEASCRNCQWYKKGLCRYEDFRFC